MQANMTSSSNDGFVPDSGGSGDGFVPDQQGQDQSQELPSDAKRQIFSSFAKSMYPPMKMIPDAGNLALGAANSIKEGAYEMPKRALESGLQMASGTPYSETPSGQQDTQFVQNAPQMGKDMIRSYAHPIDSLNERPFSTALDWTTAYQFGKAGVTAGARAILPTAENLTKNANQRWFKALGGTLQQAKEIGPEEAQRLGRMARNENIITPTNSAESQMGNVQAYQDAAGQKIGELRQIGDQMGAAPKFHVLIGEIEKELGPQYESGMMSPQQGQFRNAMDELTKTERVNRIPEDIPEGSGSYQVTKKEPNPLFTPVSKQIEAQNPMGPMVAQKNIFKPNPSYLSDQPEIRSTKDVPRNIFEDYRGDQESGNLIPEYDIKKPGTTDIANKVTQMNKFAKSQTKLLQPSNAITDVANAASAKNDSALVQSLGSEKGLDYVRALGNFSDSEKMMKILENKLAYETGASRNRIVNNLINRFEQRFGYPVSAEALDRLSGVKNGVSIFGKGIATTGVATNASNVLTKEKAREILKDAGGNKEKARQRAKDLGYSLEIPSSR